MRLGEVRLEVWGRAGLGMQVGREVGVRMEAGVGVEVGLGIQVRLEVGVAQNLGGRKGRVLQGQGEGSGRGQREPVWRGQGKRRSDRTGPVV